MRHPWTVVFFAAAMGILEAAVVVYLRHIYYPAGFGFPLVRMDRSIFHIEVIREAMTIVMLACVARIAAERTWGRLMAFLVAFGVWDIMYYVGLKIWLGWPASLVTPDILFLIPRPWVGPVLAPVLVSALWIVAGLTLHRANVKLLLLDWAGAIGSAGLILASFLSQVPAGPARAGGGSGDPRFLWLLFLAGYLVGILALYRIARRSRVV